MTEQQWLTSGDPTFLLHWLTQHPINPCREINEDGSWPYPHNGPPSNRKLRLFAAACVRQVAHLLVDDAPCDRCAGTGVLHPRTYCPNCNDNGKGVTPGRVNRSLNAVLVAERFADGQSSVTELEAANEAAEKAFCVSVRMRKQGCPTAASEAERLSSSCETSIAKFMLYEHKLRRAEDEADLIRDTFGNPFRPWNGGKPLWGFLNRPTEAQQTVLTLAGELYYKGRLSDGRFDQERLGVLADALEEADLCGDPDHRARLQRALDGCSCDDYGDPSCEDCTRAREQLALVERDALLLGRLRSGKPLYRGGWPIDVLLGKA